MYSRFRKTAVPLINILILAFFPQLPASGQVAGPKDIQDNDQVLSFTDSGRTSIPIDFRLANNLIIIPLQINGSDTLWFILDTGISQSVITEVPATASLNLNDARKIDLRVPGSPVAVPALHSTGNETSLSGLHGTNQDYYILINDNLNLSRKTGTPVHGILSYSVLSPFVVEIDYENQVITIYRGGYSPFSGKQDQQHPIPIAFIDDKAYIAAGIEPYGGTTITVKLLLDTGFSNSIWLNKGMVPKEMVPSQDDKTYLGCGIAGDVYVSLMRLKTIRLDHHLISDAIVCYPDSSSLICSKGITGNPGSLGAEILKRFTVIINYPDSLITFIENNDFSADFSMNMSGMNLIASSADLKSLEISYIRPDSPAEKAGLRIRDQIISIDDIPVANYSLSDIYRMFRQDEGRTLSLRVNRMGKELTFSIRLERFI